MIVPSDEANFSVVSTKDLLGRPLNDVESKYAHEKLYVKGPMQIPIPRPAVSIVGSRKATSEGLETARTIAKKLVKHGVVIVSGLAEGIDTAAHRSAIENGGKTIAVIGTPLNKVYPQQNRALQEDIVRNHLVISQFPMGHRTSPKDFVFRNRTMAIISDATIIVEASDTSGSRHQGWEALRIGRSLFIWKSIVSNPKLSWYKEMLDYGAMKLSDPAEVLEVLPSSLSHKMIDIFSS